MPLELQSRSQEARSEIHSVSVHGGGWHRSSRRRRSHAMQAGRRVRVGTGMGGRSEDTTDRYGRRYTVHARAWTPRNSCHGRGSAEPSGDCRGGPSLPRTPPPLVVFPSIAFGAGMHGFASVQRPVGGRGEPLGLGVRRPMLGDRGRGHQGARTKKRADVSSK